MTEQTKVTRNGHEPFVWAPDEQRWLDPWQVTMRLKLPGMPVRWSSVANSSLEDRTYHLTTREAGGPARWVRFRVSPDGWEVQEDGLVMWAANYLELDLHGRRLEGYNPRRKKDPIRRFHKERLWRVEEIGLKDALVTLPEEPGSSYAVSKRDVRFLDAEPTPLELRIQQLDAVDQETLPPNYPLKYCGWLLEKGRRQRPYIPNTSDQVYIYRRFEEWEELRRRFHDLTVDEALVAIQAGLGRMPQYGGDDPERVTSQANLDLWHDGHWTESDVATMRTMAVLVQMERDLIRAAMQAVEAFRDFMAMGGSVVLPTAPQR